MLDSICVTRVSENVCFIDTARLKFLQFGQLPSIKNDGSGIFCS